MFEKIKLIGLKLFNSAEVKKYGVELIDDAKNLFAAVMKIIKA